MSKSREYAEHCSQVDSDFLAAYEVERLVLDLIRCRIEKGLIQTDMAERLHVSQPYLAQIERRTKKLSLDLLFRYAAELGLSLRIVEAHNGEIAAKVYHGVAGQTMLTTMRGQHQPKSLSSSGVILSTERIQVATPPRPGGFGSHSLTMSVPARDVLHTPSSLVQ